MTFIEMGGWPALLAELLERRDLSADQCRTAMAEILAGDATPAQLIGFVVALRAKGETAEEISGLLDAVLASATRVDLPEDVLARAIDIVGTGGDRSHSINVSTTAAFVIAGAGVPVCKHGARAASSKSGAADLLEALGIAADLPPHGVARCVERAGMGFCLAAAYHPSFRFAAPSRREIGVPTVFNLLGPMANPARVRRQVIGVANPAFAERMLASLRIHGSEHAWVVSSPGLDELSTTAVSHVLELRDGEVRSFDVDSVALGLAPAIPEELVGGEPAENAVFARRVLEGAKGAHRDIIVLNAAAGLVVAGLAEDLGDGIHLAAAAIDNGRAAKVLDDLIAESQAVAAELSGLPR